MDEAMRRELTEMQQELMERYNRLVDLTQPAAKKKRRTEQEELLGDAMDSLGEAIECLKEALEEE